MEDDQRCILGSGRRERGKIRRQIATHDAGRIADRDVDRPPQVGEPFLMLWPHQCFKPGDVFGQTDIEWMEIEAGPPNDPRHPSG